MPRRPSPHETVRHNLYLSEKTLERLESAQVRLESNSITEVIQASAIIVENIYRTIQDSDDVFLERRKRRIPFSDLQESDDDETGQSSAMNLVLLKVAMDRLTRLKGLLECDSIAGVVAQNAIIIENLLSLIDDGYQIVCEIESNRNIITSLMLPYKP